MKTKKIKSLLFLIPTLPIISIGSTLLSTSCSSNEEEKEITVNGQVTDYSGNALEGVNVSCNGTVTKTNNEGKYTISFTKATDVIYFEKAGYISEVVTNLSPDQSWNIKLYSYMSRVEKIINIEVKDAFGNSLPKCSVTFYPGSELYQQSVETDNEGRVSNIKIIVPQAEADSYEIPYTINRTGVDYSTRILTITKDETDYSLEAEAYQYDIKAFVSDTVASNNIIMHAHRIGTGENSALQIKLLSNFIDAFSKKDTEKQYYYKLSFCVGQGASNPKIDAAVAENYFDITFNSSGVLAKHGKALDDSADIDDIDLQYDESISKLLLTITIPKAFYDFTTDTNKVIGIHLANTNKSGTQEQTNGKFVPYGHVEADTTSTNQLCYIRLGSHNEYFAASDNVSPDTFNNISWDIDEDVNWNVASKDGKTSWNIGPKFNFGYQIKFALRKDATPSGLYILTKYQQEQMSDYLMDQYMTHFIIDTNTYDGTNGYPSTAGFDDTKVDKMFHYAPYSGYWMKKFTIKSSTKADDDEKQYWEFWNDGVRLYSKDDLMVTYIPFSILGINDITELSFACNLQFHYTGGEWFAWQGSNPTGYTGVPHFEDVASYVRFGFDDNKLIITDNTNVY